LQRLFSSAEVLRTGVGPRGLLAAAERQRGEQQGADVMLHHSGLLRPEMFTSYIRRRTNLLATMTLRRLSERSAEIVPAALYPPAATHVNVSVLDNAAALQYNP